jgi:CRP/FNR family transcriptional regulator, cyclic AMP receptor protein
MEILDTLSHPKSQEKLKGKSCFDVRSLDAAGIARKVATYSKAKKIYSQGDEAASVMYIQKGGVKLSVVNDVGKEAIMGILGRGDFFGEGCLAGQRTRIGTATTFTSTSILIVEKSEMKRMLYSDQSLSDQFMSYVLSRNIRIEQDLIDQLFNSSEKRLARTLLLLARYTEDSQPHKMLPNVSQRMLAGMIGTSRSRVNYFMNKFKKLGFIQYDNGLQIDSSLLSVVLHE